MKKQLIHFIGIDVSKLTIDVAVIKDGNNNQIYCLKLANNSSGFKELKGWLSANKIIFEQAVFCIEHTGYYSKQLAKFIIVESGNLWMEMSLKIIRSLGVQRGKNDKLDAKRIALFAQRNVADFIPYKPQRAVICSIKTLLILRDKLINGKNALLIPINELSSIDKASGAMALKSVKPAIDAITKNIKSIDEQIDKIIAADAELAHLFKLVTSVPGVGRITFFYLLYFTNEFKNYSEAKQLACYCGVVPFEYTSGSSVRGKPKVHNMANKQMKKLLHTCALSAVTYCPEFKEYYVRKVAEGKSRMLVLNNVKNKLIIRIAAVVKNNTVYKIAA